MNRMDERETLYRRRRIFTAPLVHADEMHLIYNLSSFLFKGAQLETKMAESRLSTPITITRLHSTVLSITQPI